MVTQDDNFLYYYMNELIASTMDKSDEQNAILKYNCHVPYIVPVIIGFK